MEGRGGGGRRDKEDLGQEMGTGAGTEDSMSASWAFIGQEGERPMAGRVPNVCPTARCCHTHFTVEDTVELISNRCPDVLRVPLLDTERPDFQPRPV